MRGRFFYRIICVLSFVYIKRPYLRFRANAGGFERDSKLVNPLCKPEFGIYAAAFNFSLKFSRPRALFRDVPFGAPSRGDVSYFGSSLCSPGVG